MGSIGVNELVKTVFEIKIVCLGKLLHRALELGMENRLVGDPVAVGRHANVRRDRRRI